MPYFSVLDKGEVDMIISSAKEILWEVGVKVYNGVAPKIYSEGGAEVSYKEKLVRIGPDRVDEALRAAPSSFDLFSRDGEERFKIGEGFTYFIPGSAAIKIIDRGT